MFDRIQVFDPHQDFAVIQRRLPHWSQAGTIAFLTWRTWDSMPEHVLKDWLAERNPGSSAATSIPRNQIGKHDFNRLDPDTFTNTNA